MKPRLRKFRVRGSYPFPVDMLRYDACWPATETDSFLLHGVIEAVSPVKVVEITLATYAERSTPGRWESGLWKVTNHEVRDGE